MRGYALLLASLPFGCSRPDEPQPSPDTATYTIRDSGAYANAVSGGEYAVLLRNGAVVDSIDLFFGLQRLNNGTIVFLPVESYVDEDIVEDGVTAMDITKHVLYHGNRRDTLASLLPHFDDRFSSPSVIGGVLYYWGLEKAVTSGYKLHAVRYDALANSIVTRPLFESELETDNRGHLTPPQPVAGMIQFGTFERTFFLSPDLQKVELIPPTLVEPLQSARDSVRARAAAQASPPWTPTSRPP